MIMNLNFATEWKLIGSFITAFITVIFAIPSIIKVAELKNLYDTPNKRKLHKKSIPTLGGIAIFAGSLLASLLWVDNSQFREFQHIIAAVIVLLFIGMKDDILIIAPFTKFGGQILAAIIVVLLGKIRITDFNGFLGIHEIHPIISILVSLFIIIGLINSFNFIDGIDGLAASIGIIASTAFGIWFYLVGEIPYLIICTSLTGALIAFIRFNVFGKSNKIFMGDTGSMIIGLFVCVMAFKFNELNEDINHLYYIYSVPALIFSILVIPVFDTIRVVFIRIIIHQSLSTADKNHIHHRLIRLGYSHIKSTSILVIVNILFIAITFCFQKIGNFRLILIIMLLAMILSYIPTLIMERRRRKQ